VKKEILTGGKKDCHRLGTQVRGREGGDGSEAGTWAANNTRKELEGKRETPVTQISGESRGKSKKVELPSRFPP